MDDKEQKFAAELVRKLDAFKTAKEWSDFISLLTSLDQTIKKNPTQDIPHKKLLFKRLNQCLNPVLPAGIHNKALETYALIFESVSKKVFIKDFDFLTLGFFSFSAHSRILVINTFLDIVEKYILPLGESIEEYSYNVLIGLLPPLEFTSGEYYNRAFSILSSFKSSIPPSAFYHAIWCVYLRDNRLRTSISNFILNSQKYPEITENQSLVIKALCAGLEDDDTLVVRNCLDLISYIFPNKESIKEEELRLEIGEYMAKLFIKRDHSLSKRIYNWLNLNNDSFYDEDAEFLCKVLHRLISKHSQAELFKLFRILAAISDKVELYEKLFDSILFDALICLEESGKEVHRKCDDFLEEENSEAFDINRVAEIFLGIDIYELWKAFYFKLSYKLGYEISKEGIEEDNGENLPVPVDLGTVIPNEDYSHTVLVKKDEFIENDSHLDDFSNENKDEDNSTCNSYTESEDYESEESDFKRSKEANKLEKKIRRQRMRIQNESLPLSPSKILEVILNTAKHYQIVDEEILKCHLPFITNLILSYPNSFEESIFFNFLDFSIDKIKFQKERKEAATVNVLNLINKFFVTESPEVLKQVIPLILYSIGDGIGRLINKNLDLSIPIIENFILLHGVDAFNTKFIHDFYKMTLASNIFLMEKCLTIYKILNCSFLDPKSIFDVLWNKFCKETYEYQELLVPESSNLLFYRVEEDINCDKEFIVKNISNYNTIFQGAFENFLLKKISENKISELSHFLYLKIETIKENFDFLELYFVINGKLDTNNSVITVLVSSITDFNDIFKFLIHKLEECNIYSNGGLYIDSPDVNKILGIFKTIKTMLNYSENFRQLLISQENKITTEFFSPESEITYIKLLNKVLHYFFTTRGEAECRGIYIASLDLLRILITNEVLEPTIFNSTDLPLLISSIKDDRNDLAIILNSFEIVRAIDDLDLIADFCTILDDECFYYKDMLKFIFSLPDRLQRKILLSCLSSLKKGKFSLAIYYRIMENLLLRKEIGFELSLLVDKGVEYIYEYFKKEYMPIDEHPLEGYKYDLDEIAQSKKHQNQKKRLNDLPLTPLLSMDGYESRVSSIHASPIRPTTDVLLKIQKRGNIRINELNLEASTKMASLFFTKLPSKFMELVLQNDFSPSFMRNINFKENFYVFVLKSYTTDSAMVFSFLTNFNQVFNTEELIKVFERSKAIFEQMSLYRATADYSMFQYALPILLRLKSPNVLTPFVKSFISNAINYLNKRFELKVNTNDEGYKENQDLLWCLCSFTFKDDLVELIPDLLTLIFNLVITPKSKLLKKLGIDALQKVIDSGIETRSWGNDMLRVFHRVEFFTFALYEKSNLVSMLLKSDPTQINALLAGLEPGFFTSQTADATNKVFYLKRISFLLFSSPYNFFTGFATKIIEKIASLINYPSIDVKKEVLFLAKILLIRVSNDKLMNLYPVLFYDISVTAENPEAEDLKIFIETLKLLDIVFLIDTPQLSELRWVFIKPKKDKVIKVIIENILPKTNLSEDGKLDEKKDLTEADLLEANEETENVENENIQKTNLINEMKEKILAKHEITVIKRKRPMPLKKIPLLSYRKIKYEDILWYLDNVTDYYNWLDENCFEIDNEFLFQFLLSEFKEN